MKQLPDAIHAIQAAQDALDTALVDGRDTAQYHNALQSAIAQKQALQSALAQKQALIDQRRADRIAVVAAAIRAAAQDSINRLLAAYPFELGEKP